MAGEKSSERIECTTSTSHVLGKLSTYILVYALVGCLDTNVHTEYFKSFYCVPKNSVFPCEIKHSTIFCLKKKYMWTSDAW